LYENYQLQSLAKSLACIQAYHEIKKLQSNVDKIYRHIWSSKNKQPLREMEEKGVNMFKVRKLLGVDSIGLKIEHRTLQRIGHVMRMQNNKLAKKVTLGWPTMTVNRTSKRRCQTTIDFWRQLTRNAGEEPEMVDIIAEDRERWKDFVSGRIEHIRKFEASQAERDGLIQERHQRKVHNDSTCSICGKSFATHKGLKMHTIRSHRKNRQERKRCDRCDDEFENAATLTNHQKTCLGAKRGTCPYCLEEKSKSNMARHVAKCRLAKEIQTGYQRPEIAGNTESSSTNVGPRQSLCEWCNQRKSTANMARHKKTCPQKP
jgi:hypothetical protein